jgi:hypothetical protein
MLDGVNFTREDLIRSRWRDIIASCDKNTCSEYSRAFIEAARTAEDSGNNTLYQVYSLLHAVSGLWLKPEEKFQPFAPLYIRADGARTVDISDFSDSHIDILIDIFAEIDDPELRARIGDVIWTNRHIGNFRFAEASVDAYMLVGEELLTPVDYIYGIERWTRAIHLAASLGRNSKKFSEVVIKIEALIEQHSPTFQPFVGRLLELLYEYRQGNSEANASVAEAFAEYYQQRGEWHFSRAYWNAAARWHRLSSQFEAEQGCLLKEAECYVSESDDSLKHSSGMQHSIAARHLQSAIEALRRIPGTDSRRMELHRRMLELQSNSRGELERITKEVDLTPIVEKSILSVRGKSFCEAVFALCVIGSSPNLKRLRGLVDKIAKEAPLQFILTMDIINDNGRIVGRRDSMYYGTPDEVEAATQAEMQRLAHIEQNMLAMVIDATRIQIIQGQTPGIRDLMELTTNNQFIPPGREVIFARGYLAGLQGDFLESLSLLVPQVENSIRYLLNQQGIITSSLSSEGIQEEFDLNILLEMPESKDIFGEDLLFDLKCNLTSRFGSNFRNLMAHGLLDHQDFYSYTAVYIWWLLLRICCIPLIIAKQQEESKDATTTTDEN